MAITATTTYLIHCARVFGSVRFSISLLYRLRYNRSAMKLAAAFLIVGAAVWAAPSRPVQEFSTSVGTVRITPIQHATLMIEAGGKVIHVDPWSSGNYDGLPAADLILITDIHGDHMDPKILPKVQKAGTVILAPEAVAKTITTATVIRNGETKTIGAWTIEAVPDVQHEARARTGQTVPR